MEINQEALMLELSSIDEILARLTKWGIKIRIFNNEIRFIDFGIRNKNKSQTSDGKDMFWKEYL